MNMEDMNKCECGRYICEDERECKQCIFDEEMDDSEADAAFREMAAKNGEHYD
jgi:hypothetical protein